MSGALGRTVDRDYPNRVEAERLPLPGATAKPVLTWALLAVNLVMWLAVLSVRGSADLDVLRDFGAMYGPLVKDGEYWRLLTAMFLHASWMHLGLNSLALLIFGQLVERAFGRSRFLAIFLLGGLAGSVASYLFNPVATAVGASGAIFAVFGALAAYFLTQRKVLGRIAQQNLRGLVLMAVVNLILGQVIPGIDNAAHIGGLVAGFALGFVLSPVYRRGTTPFGLPGPLVDVNSLVKRWWVVPTAVAVLGAGTILGNGRLPDHPDTRLFRAERSAAELDYDTALREISAAIDLAPRYGRPYLERGKIHAELGNVPAALADLARAMIRGDADTRREATELFVELESAR